MRPVTIIKYLCFFSKKFIVSPAVKDYEELLPADIFIRIHNPTIENQFYVDKLIPREGGLAVMRNGNIPDVSMGKKSTFLQAIGY